MHLSMKIWNSIFVLKKYQNIVFIKSLSKGNHLDHIFLVKYVITVWNLDKAIYLFVVVPLFIILFEAVLSVILLNYSCSIFTVS